MIRSIKINQSFVTKLPNFEVGKTFEFTDGLNILLGPNGSGKSSVLKMLKAYCAIEKAGWSRIAQPLTLGANLVSHFPTAYRYYAPGRSECDVDWDGIPSFYNDGDVKIDQWAWFTHSEILSEDGMTTESEQMQALEDKPSSGQYRLAKINKMFNMVEHSPDLSIAPENHPAQKAECDYIKSLGGGGKVTLLLDEPERALSLPKQVELFKLLEKMAEKYQIIIATHSPFVLFDLKAKIFDIENGYADQCVDIIKNCVK